MKKRLMAVLLVAAMAMSMLVGCGGGEEAPVEETEVKEETIEE